MIGVASFAAASLLCAVAPSVGMLHRRPSPGVVGAALLTPGSLAIIEASFQPEDRSAAVGAWSDLTDGFRTGVLICAVLSLAGGLLALATIRRPEEPEGVRAEPLLSCPIGAPTLARTSAGGAARP